MSFLAPLFLLGALAIAGPVIFHLIRRNTKEKFSFSSLMFLRADPPRVTRKSKLEDVLLLLLRCTLLAVMALAFSRPFLRNNVNTVNDPSAGQRMVILLDASASMQREGLWEKAQKHAQDYLKELEPTDSLTILTFDNQTTPLMQFDQWQELPEPDRIPAAIETLKATKPGWAGSHLGNAILNAAELLEENEHLGASKIVIITDRQEGIQLEGLQGYEWPPGIQISLKTVKPETAGNAGIQLKPLQETEDSATHSIRLTNSEDSSNEEFRLTWIKHKQNASTNNITVYVPAGQSRTVKAPRRPPGEGWQLNLLGDTHPFDNTLHITPLIPEPLRIHYLGNEQADDINSMRFYLERAFSTTRLQHVSVVGHPTTTQSIELNRADDRLLIIGDTIKESQVDDIRKFIENGHSVLLALKSESMSGSLTALAKSGPVPLTEARVDKYALLSQLDFEHPLLAPFHEPRYSDFTKIHFWKHRSLDPARLPGAKILARFDNGDPALMDLRIGRGHLFILTCGWQPEDSQLALASKFVPLLYSMLELGESRGKLKSNYFSGETIKLPGKSDQNRILYGPDGKLEVPAGTTTFNAKQPGLYTLEESQSVSFAVNVSPRESKTSLLPMERLDALNLPFSAKNKQTAKITQNREQTLIDEQTEKRQKIWRWLIVIAILLVLLETWLGGWLWRKPTRNPEPVGETT